MPSRDGSSFRERTRLGTKRIKDKISETLGIKVKQGGEGKAKASTLSMRDQGTTIAPTRSNEQGRSNKARYLVKQSGGSAKQSNDSLAHEQEATAFNRRTVHLKTNSDINAPELNINANAVLNSNYTGIVTTDKRGSGTNKP